MHSDKIIRKILRVILILAVFFVEFKCIHTVYAATTPVNSDSTVSEEQTLEYYFDWTPEESASTETDVKELTRIAAYSVKDADVLELYGITREDINDFWDTQALIFELDDVFSDIGTRFFLDFDTPHLNYTLITTVNDKTRIILMIPIENTWYFVEKEDCVQVYIMSADLTLQDLSLASTNPELFYPEDKLIIPTPVSMNLFHIQDKDNYLKNNFQILLSGNYISFYNQTQIINPYEAISNITIEYDSNTNQTILTFETEHVCAYTYSFENDYLVVTVGRPSELYNKIIVLDAGHGGKDPGAVDATGTIFEKTICYNVVCSYAKDLFANSDIKVYFTRETDEFITLKDRANFAAKVEADLFISLHINASEITSAHGTDVFYSKYNNTKLASGLNSYQLAKTLADKISTSLGSRLRGVNKSDYYVARYNSVPAVLIELGFISNPDECAKLNSSDYQKKAAEAIYQSVIEIFNTYPTGR